MTLDEQRPTDTDLAFGMAHQQPIDLSLSSDYPQPAAKFHDDISPQVYGGDAEKQSTSKDGYAHISPQPSSRFSGMMEADVVHFRTMSWWHAALLMIAEIISLGILSLPSAYAALGFVLSTVLLIIFGIIATYTGYVIGQFKVAHPHVTSFADAGELLFAPLGHPRIGREIFAFLQVIFLTFISGAHILTFSIMMNVLTDHGLCTIIFLVIGMVLSILLTLPRTLKNVSYLSIFSCLSIFGAVVLTMAYVGAAHTNRGDGISLGLPKGVKVVRQIVAISNMTLAYAGNVAFFGFFSELKQPKDFPKAIVMLQASATSIYIIAGAVIYYYVGKDVPSPALGATTPVIRKIAYGIAIPTIVVAGVVNGHVACRYVFNRWCGNDETIIRSKAWPVRLRWVIVVVTLWAVAWVLAEAIPVFNSLLGLIASLLGSWFTYGASGWLWLHMNRGRYAESLGRVILTLINCFLILLAITLCIMGMYASIVELVGESNGMAFSCKDNAPVLRVDLSR